MQAARKLSHYEQWHQPISAPVVKVEPRSVRKSDPQMARLTFQTVVCVAIVFCAMVFLLVRYSDIAQQKVHIYQMKTEIRKMELTRDELKASIDKGMDLEAVETTAIEKLGMQYPEQTQIVYIQKTALYTLKEPRKPAIGNPADTLTRWVQSVPWFMSKQAKVLNAE